MNVLSLFDGISCGQVALTRGNHQIGNYYAYEISKHAISITQQNFPDTVQCGDVLAEDFTKYRGQIALLLGGSPCQSLSITQSKTREHLQGKSKLFFEYVRVLEEAAPQYFLFENVASMNEESKAVITSCLGVEPVLINSNSFLAQDRARLYWTNISLPNVELSECSLVLTDILQDNVPEKYFYSQRVFDVDMTKKVCATLDISGHDILKRVNNANFKCQTLTTCGGGNTQKKVLIGGRARKLTPTEYERLQGLDDDYTAGIAETHRYTAIGNAWSVNTIEYIFNHIKN